MCEQPSPFPTFFSLSRTFLAAKASSSPLHFLVRSKRPTAPVPSAKGGKMSSD